MTQFIRNEFDKFIIYLSANNLEWKHARALFKFEIKKLEFEFEIKKQSPSLEIMN